MKRWILALVMLGLSVVPALAETAVTTGMGYKKMLSELCALYKHCLLYTSDAADE